MTAVQKAVPLAFGTSTNIRLLELLHDQPTGSDSISCKLSVISLSDESRYMYTAVSYEWGDASVTRTIILNDKLFTVRQNLWSLLRQLSDEGYQGYLWIDALCIDQENNAERSHQVSMMGEIYAKALTVMVWLGPETDTSASIMKEISKCWNVELGGFKIPREWKSLAKCFSEICSATYWTRLWVVQEFVLADDIDIRWGGSVLEGRKLLRLYVTSVYVEEEHGHAYMEFGSYVADTMWGTPAGNILKCRDSKEYPDRNSHNLLFMIADFKDLACADVRDRVYSLLSLTNPEELKLLSITPNYSKSPCDLFVDICTSIRAAGPLYDGDDWIYYIEDLRELLGLSPEEDVVKREMAKLRLGDMAISDIVHTSL